MAIKSKIKKVKKGIIKGVKNNVYIKAYKGPLNDKAFLLEAGQGKNVNGNVFALLRYIRQQQEFDDYKVYLSLVEDVTDDAEEMLRKYGIENVTILGRGKEEYRRALGSAKYLITDNSFPGYLNKRDDQVYINTWHGTPLKALGRTDIENAASLANVQANMLKADYLLHPNEFTKDIMMNDYMVEKLFKNKTVIIDYPRNDALYKEEFKDEILKKYDLEGKRLIAYMPTWRGAGRAANIEEQVKDIERIIEDIERGLSDDEILCVNLHFLIGNRLDYSKYSKVMSFPQEYETYDFLAICDTLITDYSSVAIDFAGTEKEVILYMYDYEQYKADKGFYIDIKSLPFKQTYNIDELQKALHSEKKKYKLDSKFVADNRGDSCRQVIDLICKGREEGLDIQDYSEKNSGVNLVVFENIKRAENQKLLRLYQDKLSDEEKKLTVIGFGDKINPTTAEILRSLDDGIDYLRFIKGFPKNATERVCVALFKKTGLFSGVADKFYAREAKKMLDIMDIDRVTVLQNRSIDKFFIYAKAKAETVLFEHPKYSYGRNGKRFIERPEVFPRIAAKYDRVEKLTEEEDASLWDELKCYGTGLSMSNPHYMTDGNSLRISGQIHMATDADFEIAQNAVVSEIEYPISKMPECKKNERGITEFSGDFELEIPFQDMEDFHKHNRLFLQMKVAGSTILIPVRYTKPSRSEQTYFEIGSNDGVCNIRNSKGLLDLEVRPKNITDSSKERARLYVAWLCSRITPFYKPVLLYEKDSSRYEESASCVFERLIDAGYKNVYFILDKDYEHRDTIPEKYRKYLIDRFSFRHYYSMFAAKSLISTEAPAHLLEPNAKSRRFTKYVVGGRQNYVFLQHGVMYMVSLNSESRAFFRKKKLKRTQRVVVSSELEAKHFMDYAGYRDIDMYISGLPKFDRSVKDDDADAITVMLTWRPWEYNQANRAFEETKYYQMTERIVQAVPEHLKDKLIVLPHPRVADLAERNRDKEVWKYSIFDEKYDDILKRTKILITDYSSISYDAFYRGSNIIFCWSEMDECMSEYGPSTYLMLSEDLAFGDVAYDENITELISKNYSEGQSAEHVANYRRIVQFHDGHNTDRVIEMMKEDEII